MLRIVRIFKTLTSLLFIAVLLITYAFTANKVNVYLDIEKLTIMKVESLFFWSLGVFVAVNLLFLFFDRTLLKYRNKKKKFSNLMKSEKFQSWVSGLNIAVNLFLSSMVLFIGFLNSDKEFKLLDYTFILYVGPVAVLLALLALPLVFIPDKKSSN